MTKINAMKKEFDKLMSTTPLYDEIFELRESLYHLKLKDLSKKEIAQVEDMINGLNWKLFHREFHN